MVFINDNLPNTIVNYLDCDPISLELIQDLPLSRLFFVTNKQNNKKYAYDAINWFIHISNDRRHPITRNKLSNEELWNLYLVTTKQIENIIDIELLRLLYKSLDIYHSAKIKLKKKDNKCILLPISPLFTINIEKLQLQNKGHKMKIYSLTYGLTDSRDNKTIICQNQEATITLPNAMSLSFSN